MKYTNLWSLLIVAEAYGLPFLPAYLTLSNGQNISQGVNFAFAGATALDFEFFKQKGVEAYAENSLSIQLGWFKKLKPSLCKNKEGYTKTPSLFVLSMKVSQYD